MNLGNYRSCSRGAKVCDPEAGSQPVSDPLAIQYRMPARGIRKPILERADPYRSARAGRAWRMRSRQSFFLRQPGGIVLQEE